MTSLVAVQLWPLYSHRAAKLSVVLIFNEYFVIFSTYKRIIMVSKLRDALRLVDGGRLIFGLVRKTKVVLSLLYK